MTTNKKTHKTININTHKTTTTIHTKQLTTTTHTRHLQIQHVQTVKKNTVRNYCIQFAVFFLTHVNNIWA